MYGIVVVKGLYVTRGVLASSIGVVFKSLSALAAAKVVENAAILACQTCACS